jgi:hypothetical protein
LASFAFKSLLPDKRVETNAQEREAKIKADAEVKIAGLTAEAEKARADIANARAEVARANQRT